MPFVQNNCLKEKQDQVWKNGGCWITNGNCSLTMYVLSLSLLCGVNRVYIYTYVCMSIHEFIVIIAPLWKCGGYTGFALSIQILWFRHSDITFQMKLEYLLGQSANLDQILYEASLGWGKGCIRFWDRLDQNYGFHGNRKRPLTYNWENNVSTFSLLFLIRSFSNLQVTRTGTKSRTCSDFSQIEPCPTQLGVLEHLKNFP